MSASFRDRIRNFLLTWEGVDEIYSLLLRMIFAKNNASLKFHEFLTGYYGQLNRTCLEEDVLPDLIEMLMEKRAVLLDKKKLNMSYVLNTLKNGVLDRIRKKNIKDAHTGEMPRFGSGEDAEDVEIRDENSFGEAEYVQRLSAEELAQLWVRSLSEGELRTFCDYLAREHGDKRAGDFLENVSENARHKQVSRLKKRLKELNRQYPDYEMLQDQEIWQLAFSFLQSEICPGLRLHGVNDIGSVAT